MLFSCYPFFVLHSFCVILWSSCIISMPRFFPCRILTYCNFLACSTLYVLYFFHTALIPCCAFSRGSLFSCCTSFMLHFCSSPLTPFTLHCFMLCFYSCFFMLHSVHVVRFWCYTLFGLYFFHPVLFSCCTFLCVFSLFMEHFFRVTLFSCCTFFMLHTSWVALNICCTFSV